MPIHPVRNAGDVDDIICSAMLRICPSVWKNVCRQTPLPDDYIVHDSEDDRTELYEGDRDSGMAYNRRVHLYTRWNPHEKNKKIRQALRMAGFTLTGSGEVDEKEGFTHSIIYAYILGGIEE